MGQYSSEDVLTLASDAGRLLLENGAEISRVEETMERIAGHYGQSGEKFFVLSNGIFTTGKAYANAEFIPIKGARLDVVAEVNQFSRDISAGKYTLEQARERLDKIKCLPAKPDWEMYLGAVFGCAGFCIIFGGSFLDCAASMVAALLLNLFVMKVSGKYLTKALANIFGGLFGTLLCILFQHFGFGHNIGNMVVGTMILLIPGVAFTNGLRDVANEDYLAGITRLADAVMMFMSIAIGVCFAFMLYGFFAGNMIQLSGTNTDSLTSTFPVQMAAALVGTSAFAILYGVPRRHYLPAGLVGLAGWTVYLAFTRFVDAGPFAASFFAATVVSFLSRFFARRFRCPRTIYLICGIFPLIPGGGVFWSAYYIASNQLNLALSSGFMAVKVTIAIVLGIIISANVFNNPSRRNN
ncbi:MAG: threonine/serine exporter ThrE family protein [Candidatus Cryptobacteroides sp.]